MCSVSAKVGTSAVIQTSDRLMSFGHDTPLAEANHSARGVPEKKLTETMGQHHDRFCQDVSVKDPRARHHSLPSFPLGTAKAEPFYFRMGQLIADAGTVGSNGKTASTKHVAQCSLRGTQGVREGRCPIYLSIYLCTWLPMLVHCFPTSRNFDQYLPSSFVMLSHDIEHLR